MGDIDFNCHACDWNWRGVSWHCPKCGVNVVETRGPQTYTTINIWIAIAAGIIFSVSIAGLYNLKIIKRYLS